MRRWRTITATLLLMGGCASGSGGESPGELVSELASGAGEATLVLSSNWGSGYCAELSVANTGSATITDWAVTLDFKAASVSSLWNGNHSGSLVTPVSHNASIAAGAKASVGFCANVSSPAQIPPEITALTVAGGGSPPAPNPPPPNPPATEPPPTNPDYPPIGGGCNGYATRFWDCCKPHCGWQSNVPSGVSPINSCSASNTPLSDANAQSSCNGGGSFMCQGLAPFAVNDSLSYGYAATSNGDVCGRCYQLQFSGASHNAGDDPGSKALAGKTMIVQAMNVGFDVGGGQFDLLVPGGGVGAFNACSSQWGVSNDELGAQYGGFLTKCKQRLGHSASLSDYKSCVAEQCTNVFEQRGLTDLAAGCRWYVDWFQAADNPSLKYKEVPCPAELSSESGMNRSSRNDVSRACGD